MCRECDKFLHIFYMMYEISKKIIDSRGCFVVNIFYRNGRFERIPPSIIPLFFSYFFALFFRVIRISKLFLLAFFASAFSHFDNPVIVL